MNCPTCQTPHAAAARFCSRCGTPLHAAIDRDAHYAANPDEPVRALAVLSTLMPHLSGGRHHAYRTALTVALLVAGLAAGFGVLSVALVCAAVALPAVLLAYLHDHNAWHDEPLAVLGGGFVLALAGGIGTGFLARAFASQQVLALPARQFPGVATLLDLGVVVPVVALAVTVICALIVTARPKFRHPLDAVNAATVAGAALSLGLSIVVQSGAFTHAVAQHVDPARAAFIAITLGFLQPLLFAAAAALVAMRLRRKGSSAAIGAIEALLVVVLYELAATMLAPYGSRGVVLTALVAGVLLVAATLLVRSELHTGLLAEARAALEDSSLHRPAVAGQACGHCHADLPPGAAFCQACGTASVALARPATARTATAASTRAASAA